jgi:hypothetical protein
MNKGLTSMYTASHTEVTVPDMVRQCEMFRIVAPVLIYIACLIQSQSALRSLHVWYHGHLVLRPVLGRQSVDVNMYRKAEVETKEN